MIPSAAPAAGVHLPWALVPDAVRAWAAAVGGGAPQAVRDLQGGFSPGAAARLECPDRSIFVKAVGAELNADSPAMHRREAVISASLPSSPHTPRLLDVYDDGGWVALAFEAIDGRLPRHPWDAGELDTVLEALGALHDSLTPTPDPQLEQADQYLRRVFGGWAELAAMPRPPEGLDPWAATWTACRAGGRLAGRQRGATLVHGDVRSDNLLFGPAGVVLVDWPHAAVGTPVLDLVEWAPSVVLEGGPEPEELLKRHRQSRQADPDVVTILLAAVCGYLVAHSLRPPAPGLPTVRAFQAAQGEVALAWLRHRTRW